MGNSFINNGIFDEVRNSGQFKYSGRVFLLKFLKQFFIVLLTNLSSFILVTVDGFVASHFVGLDALNSVNLLNPFVLLIGATTGLLAGGVNIVLSKTYGLGSKNAITKLFRAIFLLTIFFFIGTTIIQIPIVYLMINAYSVSAEIKEMIGLYAIGLIIANSVSVINTVGAYMLIASGRVKVLLKLAILESTLNVLFDLFFVSVCNMGILGTGLGTAISCTVRAVATIVIIQKTLKLFPTQKIDCKDEMRSIILNGLPNMSTMLLISLSGYVMNAVITYYVGIEAISVVSICAVGASMFTMLSNSFVQTGNPLIGILVGSEDWKVAKDLSKRILKMCVVTVSVFVVLTIIFPGVLFAFYGVEENTSFQLLSMRIYLLRFIPLAAVTCLSNFCVYYEKRNAAIAASVIEAILLIPVFFILMFFDRNLIFLCYVICGLISVLILSTVYIKTINKKVTEGKESRIMHFCFNSNESIYISKKINDFLSDRNLSKRTIYRLALVFEEIGAYAGNGNNKKKINVFMSLRENKNSIRVFYLDDSEPPIMNKSHNETGLALGNYDLIESLSSEFLYQNVAGMNNFIITFDYAA